MSLDKYAAHKIFDGPRSQFTICAIRNDDPPLEMPIATSDNVKEIREEFAKIKAGMPHLHIKLYDGDDLIDEHSNAARH